MGAVCAAWPGGPVPITVARGATVRHARGNGRAVATRVPTVRTTVARGVSCTGCGAGGDRPEQADAVITSTVPTTVARGRTVSRTGCGAGGPVPITVARGATVRHAGGTARAVATSSNR